MNTHHITEADVESIIAVHGPAWAWLREAWRDAQARAKTGLQRVKFYQAEEDCSSGRCVYTGCILTRNGTVWSVEWFGGPTNPREVVAVDIDGGGRINLPIERLTPIG